MISIPDLSDYSTTCLKMLLDRFPQFEPFIRPSDEFDGCWAAEIPWPDQSRNGLIVQTGNYRCYNKDEFRIDIGTWHSHYVDWSDAGTYNAIDDGLNTIDDFINERLVLVEKGSVQYIYSIGLEKNDFDMDKQEWINGLEKVVKSSWNGSFEKVWLRDQESTSQEN